MLDLSLHFTVTVSQKKYIVTTSDKSKEEEKFFIHNVSTNYIWCASIESVFARDCTFIFGLYSSYSLLSKLVWKQPKGNLLNIVRDSDLPTTK